MKKFYLATIIALLIVFFSNNVFAASIKNDKLNDFLYLCATSTYEEIALVLDEQDKDVKDKNGMTALMHAVRYNPEPKIVKLLIDYGFSVNAVDNSGRSVLMHAMYLNDINILTMLLANGADANACFEKSGNITPLMLAARYSNKLEVFQLLTENGAQIENEDIYGNTVFSYACRYNDNLAVIKYLLAEGAKINKANKAKMTPLMLTALNATQGPEIAQIILQEGADIHVFDEGMNTALIYAALYSDEIDLYKILLSYGADIDFSNIAGYTALDYAKFNERSEEIQRLLIK